jgi:hypothetical protein
MQVAPQQRIQSAENSFAEIVVVRDTHPSLSLSLPSCSSKNTAQYGDQDMTPSDDEV